MRDEAMMSLALAQAARAIGNTSPNPMVGAVVAASDGDKPIASGYHERAGAPHAEAIALGRAGDAARGATLYVTLEPCVHEGRTPPCTDAILRAGVARVVVATFDDDTRVHGAGIERLRAAGVRVDVGVGEAQAQRLNRMYFHQRRTGQPYVTLKMAQSIDGAIGPSATERYALTGESAASHVRSLRYEHDAVMIGVGTAMVDDPKLTVRPFRQRAVPYVRVVVDSSARLPTDLQIIADRKRAATIVATTDSAPGGRIEALRAAGAEVAVCRSDPQGRVDLIDLLEHLGGRGMLGVLCEGGPRLATSLLGADLVDELHVIVAPVFLGTAASAPATHPLQTRRAFHVRSVRRLGDDTLIVADPAPANPPIDSMPIDSTPIDSMPT